MDRAQEPPAELLQVRSLIWLHALLGAALPLAFFWASFAHREVVLLAGLLGCAVAWIFAFGPVARTAEMLAPPQRPPAKAVPPEVMGVWAVAEICSLGIFEGREWILAGHLLAGGTILLRGLMAIAFEIPIHRRTWAVSLLILALGALGHLAGIIGNLTWDGR